MRILKNRETETCRACGAAPETIGHVLSKCPFHEWGLMKERHDRVLYLLVRAVLGAGSLPVPGAY